MSRAGSVRGSEQTGDSEAGGWPSPVLHHPYAHSSSPVQTDGWSLGLASALVLVPVLAKSHYTLSFESYESSTHSRHHKHRRQDGRQRAVNMMAWRCKIGKDMASPHTTRLRTDHVWTIGQCRQSHAEVDYVARLLSYRQLWKLRCAVFLGTTSVVKRVGKVLEIPEIHCTVLPGKTDIVTSLICV